jgi:hypothetical protein
MKKIILSALLITSISVMSQQAFSLPSNNGAFLPMDNWMLSKVDSNSGKTLTYNDIKGTPYYGKGYSVAKFSGSSESAPARYNSYNDQVEFTKEDKVFILPKNDAFARIVFDNSNEVLVNLNTEDDLSGYFFELVGGENILYKKVKTKFVDVVVASNSYASDKPATFKSLDPIYYIKTKNGFIKNPKNQKEIIANFPDKKESLNTFFKENKIKFDKEEDLKKLVTFLNKN